MMWSLNLSLYSIALMPRKAAPKTIVETSQNTCLRAGWLVCAARTANAIVSELTIRIAVLAAPQ